MCGENMSLEDWECKLDFAGLPEVLAPPKPAHTASKPPERLKMESAPLPLFPELVRGDADAATLESLSLPGELSIAAAPSPSGEGLTLVP